MEEAEFSHSQEARSNTTIILLQENVMLPISIRKFNKAVAKAKVPFFSRPSSYFTHFYEKKAALRSNEWMSIINFYRKKRNKWNENEEQKTVLFPPLEGNKTRFCDLNEWLAYELFRIKKIQYLYLNLCSVYKIS